MSSADSRTTSSSRLSQFGIYRSIDARTEEFLRLSRKRQIRQGCACAAVSTAITVTIVITVLLVYEYTVNLDSNPTLKSRMAAWHGMFNDTSPFEAKISKSKVNIDSTTLKLLPLVLKALNQNRNMDKTADYINFAPVTETRKDIIGHGFKKKLFYGTKLKPTQSVHTNEFKPSPAMNYGHTFNNMDYYRKMRQTKDYNRMLHYFEKMINANTPDSSESISDGIIDKSSVESNSQTVPLTEYMKKMNQSISKTKSYKEKKYVTKSTPKSSHHHKKISKHTLLPKSDISLKFGDVKQKYMATPHNRNQRLLQETSAMKVAKPCRCSKKLTDLLYKLFIDIQNILPEIELYKISCSDDKNIKSKISSSKISKTTTAIPLKITTIQHSLKTKYSSFKQNTFSTLKPKLATSHESYNFKEISVRNKSVQYMKWLPINFYLNSNATNIYNKTKEVIVTTMKAYIEPTYTTPAFQGISTEPMNNAKHKNIWKNRTKDKEAHNITSSTSPTTKSPVHLDDLEIELYLPNLEQPLEQQSFEENSFNPVVKSNQDILSHKHQNESIFPLQVKTKKLQSGRHKQNTTSIVDWFSTQKKEKKQDLQVRSKDNEQKQLFEYNNEKNIYIEPKIDIDIFQEINEYKSKNGSQSRKIIHPIWPEENKYDSYTNENSKSNKNVNKTQNLKLTDLPRLNFSKLGMNLSNWPEENKYDSYTNENSKSNKIVNQTQNLKLTDFPRINFDNNKEKAKRENILQQNKITLVRNQQKGNKYEAKTNISNNISKNLHTNTTKFVLTKKNDTDSLKSVYSQAFFSKFADINNLLFQTKNISNITIYEKFNFGNNSNHLDDNNTLASLQYDEFKFLNDEVLESEGIDAKLFRLEKYETLKSNKHFNSDDSTAFIESMIPVSRPIFLEIQRSDWKHDSNNIIEQDYGNVYTFE